METIFDWHQLQIPIDGQPYKLELLDTGSGIYAYLQHQTIECGDCFFLVYSTSSKSSFDKIPKIHQQILNNYGSHIKSEIPMILVGNKTDLSAREVSKTAGHALAEKLGCQFMETSAKTGENVRDALCAVVRRVPPNTPAKQIDEGKGKKSRFQDILLSFFNCNRKGES